MIFGKENSILESQVLALFEKAASNPHDFNIDGLATMITC